MKFHRSKITLSNAIFRRYMNTLFNCHIEHKCRVCTAVSHSKDVIHRLANSKLPAHLEPLIGKKYAI